MFYKRSYIPLKINGCYKVTFMLPIKKIHHLAQLKVNNPKLNMHTTENREK